MTDETQATPDIEPTETAVESTDTGDSPADQVTPTAPMDAEDETQDSDADEDVVDDAPDPLARWMLGVSLALIIVLLASSISIVLFLLSMRGAPRTKIEQDISRYETIIDESGGGKPEDWVKLASAYASAGRTADALEAIESGRAVKKTALLDLAEADVLRQAKKWDEALKAYNIAEKSATKEFNKMVEAQRKKGIIFEFDNQSLASVYYGRALTLHETGDLKGAIKDIESALKIIPEASYMWKDLGDYAMEAKDVAKARMAYNEALRYAPDYEDARKGLERAKKGK